MYNKLRPFHLAIPVNDLERCRTFYRDVLELPEGRSSDHWVDFDFFGHQLVIHLKEENSEITTVDEQENLKFYKNQINILERTINILNTEYSTQGTKFDELLKLHNQLIDFSLKELDSKIIMHTANLTIKRWNP